MSIFITYQIHQKKIQNNIHFFICINDNSLITEAILHVSTSFDIFIKAVAKPSLAFYHFCEKV